EANFACQTIGVKLAEIAQIKEAENLGTIVPNSYSSTEVYPQESGNIVAACYGVKPAFGATNVKEFRQNVWYNPFSRWENYGYVLIKNIIRKEGCVNGRTFCDPTVESCKKRDVSLGDCYVPGGQAFAENITGTTLTRRYRENVENMMTECTDANNSRCYLYASMLLATPFEIVGDLGKMYVREAWAEVEKSYNNFRRNPTPLNCAKYVGTILENNPTAWAVGKLGKIVDSILGAFGLDTKGAFGNYLKYFIPPGVNLATVGLVLKNIDKIVNFFGQLNWGDLDIIGESIQYGVWEVGLKGGLYEKGLRDTIYEKGLRDTIWEKGLKETIYETGLRDYVYERGLRDTIYEGGLKKAYDWVVDNLNPANWF
ncbi:MAG: hypothetical protein EBZ58_13775, partial [Bacteroidetes bacterium]|nr:hypothetical protein [Bacteroidota bacterium]